MHIAYVTETFPPEVNGVALTVARTVDYLKARGHAVDLVRPRQPHDRDRMPHDALLVPGCRIPNYPDLRFGFPVKSRLMMRWAQVAPDLVHVATEGPLGWAAVSAAREHGIPVTSDFRTRFDEYGAHYGLPGCKSLIRTYLREFHNRTQMTCVPTPDFRDELAQIGIRNLAVHGRGVDAGQFSPHRRDPYLRKQWGVLEDSTPVALYVGRLAAEKNLMAAVAAYEAMRESDPRTRFVLVGDGPWAARLRAHCPEAIFCGAQRGPQLAACFASADVFLFPSLTETFGNVTLEALASGLSVVAFDTAAARVHIRDGVNGRIVPPGNTRAFADAAAQVAADASLRLRLSVHARETALSLDWDQVLARFESALIEVATRPVIESSAQQINHTPVIEQ